MKKNICLIAGLVVLMLSVSAEAWMLNAAAGKFISLDPIAEEGGIATVPDPYLVPPSVPQTNQYQFIDTVGKPSSPQTNLYNFVGNNPVNFIDPLGLYRQRIVINGTLLMRGVVIFGQENDDGSWAWGAGVPNGEGYSVYPFPGYHFEEEDPNHKYKYNVPKKKGDKGC